MSTSRKYRDCQKRLNVCFGIARSFGRRTYCLKQRISDFATEFSMRAGVLLIVLPNQPLSKVNQFDSRIIRLIPGHLVANSFMTIGTAPRLVQTPVFNIWHELS
jgi:hypothetical protein